MNSDGVSIFAPNKARLSLRWYFKIAARFNRPSTRRYASCFYRAIIVAALTTLTLSLSMQTRAGCAALSEYPDTPMEYFGLDLDNNEILRGDHPGKIIVIAFWASWSRGSNSTLRFLEGIHRAYPPDRVLAIALNDRQQRNDVTRALLGKKDDLTMMIAFDPQGKAIQEFGKKFRRPDILVIDANGQERFRGCFFGKSVGRKAIAVIEELLSEGL